MPLSFIVKNHKVQVKGTCDTFPCAVGSWRCSGCTALMVNAYKGIIDGLHEQSRKDAAEKKVRIQQCEEMRAVIDAANTQMPILLAKTLEAQEAAKQAKSEAETAELRMKDVQAQLELAKADAIADKLKDALADLSQTRGELADVRYRLGKETLASQEAIRQQCLGATDVKNFRRYIKAARDKEAKFKVDIQNLQKRLSAIGLEMSKKDDKTSEMQGRIEELTRMSSEAIKHQDDMRHQNEGLTNIVTELTVALEAACETETQLRAQCQTLQKTNTAAHEEIAQIHSIMSFQRNETQSTKNILAREKALRKKAESQANIASSVVGSRRDSRSGGLTLREPPSPSPGSDSRAIGL